MRLIARKNDEDLLGLARRGDAGLAIASSQGATTMPAPTKTV